MPDRTQIILFTSLIGSLVGTALIYFWFVPALIRMGNIDHAVTYVVIGWIPYVLSFYFLGRLTTDPDGLPGMRPATTGSILVVLSMLISIGLDSWGLSPTAVPEAHIFQLIGVLVGLALLGWGLGKRSQSIANLQAKSDST